MDELLSASCTTTTELLLLYNNIITECSYINILAYILLIWYSVYIINILLYTPFKLYFLAQVLPGVDLNKLGRWAVITGATDGIGK